VCVCVFFNAQSQVNHSQMQSKLLAYYQQNEKHKGDG